MAVAATAKPDNAGLGTFDPDRMAALEQHAWEVYYYRQWPALLKDLYTVTREQFGLSPARSVYASYLGTRAQIVFARRGAADGEAERSMREFYEYVKEPTGGRYDPTRAAQLEVEWWVVHRNRRQYPDNSALADAIANLYVEVYRRPFEAVRPAAQYRADAMDLSDRWIDDGKLPDSPLLGQIRSKLEQSYRSLHDALAAPARAS